MISKSQNYNITIYLEGRKIMENILSQTCSCVLNPWKNYIRDAQDENLFHQLK